MAMPPQIEKQKTAASAKKYGQNPRLRQPNDSHYVPRRRSRSKHTIFEGDAMSPKVVDADLMSRVARLESLVAKLEAATKFLSSEIVQAAIERSAAEEHESGEESTLSSICRIHGIKTLPKDPAAELRGLLAEFSIEESAVDIVRDVRDNP